MTLMTKFLGAAAALALTSGVALADPAIIYDLGGKFDKSFNEAAFNGAERWKAETGGSYKELEMQSEAQREQALRRLAEAGSNPVVMTGFAFGDVLAKVAPDFPDTKFAIIDVDWLDAPNILQVAFNEHEGSYLVGMMAALASKTGTVGFIGGMDIPLIRKFGCGYAQGVKAVNPDATVVMNMTGTTPSAWNDPVKGAELAKAQKAQGADVIYAAAGGTGIGVLQSAADEGILSIGVDSNQNHLHPGKVLTSMLKRVDNAVYEAFAAGTDLETGVVKVMGLANDGVGYAMDENNASLVTPEMAAAVDDAAGKIKSGEFHPFTVVSSEPGSGRFTLLVKALGDCTAHLRDLEAGTRARVEGPYGSFLATIDPARPQLWIAGGIGITPFVSAAAARPPAAESVDLFYLVSSPQEAVGLERLQELAGSGRHLKLHCFTGEDDFAHIWQKIREQLPDLRARQVFMCGPPALVDGLRLALTEAGVAQSEIHSERFDFR